MTMFNDEEQEMRNVSEASRQTRSGRPSRPALALAVVALLAGAPAAHAASDAKTKAKDAAAAAPAVAAPAADPVVKQRAAAEPVAPAPAAPSATKPSPAVAQADGNGSAKKVSPTPAGKARPAPKPGKVVVPATTPSAKRAPAARRRAKQTRAVRASRLRAARRRSPRARSGESRRGSRVRSLDTSPAKRNRRPGTSSSTQVFAPQSAPKETPAKRERVAEPMPSATKAETERPITLVSHAAKEIVAVVPGWVWVLMAGLAFAVAGLLRRTILLGRRRRRESLESCEATVRALAAAVEAKDPCTAGHLERVQRMGLLLAQQIVPEDAGSREMAHGFLLHDVGKLAVPDAILNKPGRLDPDELAIMRTHADAGAAILDGVPGLGRGLDVVRHHHERWDGGGYPAGLAGEDIPMWARIFSVVDTLDAMTSERPYASRRRLGEALEEIEACAGSQFDPAVVGALLDMEPAVIVTTLGLNAPQVVHARRERRLAVVGA